MAIRSSNLRVKSFRTILIWALNLQASPLHGVEEIADALKSDKNWKHEPDLIKHMREDKIEEREKYDKASYAEFNYFHDFVQEFLYANSLENQTETPLLLFKRPDITSITLDANTKLDVERMSLYFFKTGVAFIVTEIASQENQTHSLAEVQTINEKIRRVFPPYFGNAPNTFENMSFYGTFHPQDEHIKSVIDKRAILPKAVWMHLLPDIIRNNFNQDWRLTSDDRMPLMTYINIYDHHYSKISEGDWQRLAFVDGAGNDKTPYASAFLKQLNNAHFYNRFHFSAGESSNLPSRIAITGYSFSIIADNSTFTEETFRRHYFQMFMLAHFEQQTLLRFSSRITHAVKHKDNFREEMSKIQSDFLEFTHRFRFTGITNQLQGIELNELIRKQMGLDELYKDVKEEIASSNAYLSSEATQKQAEATLGLTYFAAFAAMASISIALASMGLLFGDNALKILFNITGDHSVILGRMALVFLCFTVVTGITFQFICHYKVKYFLKLQSIILNIFIFCLTFAVTLGIIQHNLCYPNLCKQDENQKVEIMKNNDK